MREALEAQAPTLIDRHHMAWLGGDHAITLSLLRAYRAAGPGVTRAAGRGDGGLSTAQVFTLLEELAGLSFVGMDCVEVAPP